MSNENKDAVGTTDTIRKGGKLPSLGAAFCSGEVRFRPLDQGEKIRVGDFYVNQWKEVVIRDRVPWRQRNLRGNVMQHYRVTKILPNTEAWRGADNQYQQNLNL